MIICDIYPCLGHTVNGHPILPSWELFIISLESTNQIGIIDTFVTTTGLTRLIFKIAVLFFVGTLIFLGDLILDWAFLVIVRLIVEVAVVISVSFATIVVNRLDGIITIMTPAVAYGVGR